MLKHTALALFSALALAPLVSCSHMTADQKTQLISAAQSLTDAAFTAGGPLLSEAAMALPAEAQVLIQAGYGALRKAVEVAEAQGIEHAGAQATVAAVADTASSLSDAVHAPATSTAAQP